MIILKALVGSRLHGLHNKNSDYDWKSIQVSPLRDIISPFRKQKNKETISKSEDICNYELTHFAKLFADCNPTILEILWAKDFEIKYSLGEELISRKSCMLQKDKIFYSHRGYANDQRSKMSLNCPNENRTAKAIVACIRVMHQGISLLRTKDFNPEVIDPELKKVLYQIKYTFRAEEHVAIALDIIHSLEQEFQDVYDNCKLEFSPDFPWLEDFLLNCYMELGNGSLQSIKIE